MSQDAGDRIYRIYTTDKHRELVVELVAARFESFTIHDTTGYFKGQPEHSIIVELVSAVEEDVIPLARHIAQLNDQQSVLVVALSGEAKVLR